MTLLRKRNVIFVLFLLAIAFPFISGNYWIDVAILVLINIVLAQGLNVVAGYAGLLDLGYAAFFAIGAYTTGILMTAYDWPFLATIPVAIIFCGISGIIVAAPVLRLRSDYLAVVTLGFGEIVRITATNLQITGSATGIYGIPNPVIFGYEFSSINEFYYLILFIAIITIFATYRLGSSSRIGRAWTYIREDEDAAEAMGINRIKVKLLAFIIGAIIGGLAGSFFAVKMGAVSPQSFKVLQSIMILLAVVLGGMGSVTGVTIGAILIIGLPEVLRGVADARYMIFGLLMVVMMIVRPQGIWPAKYEVGAEPNNKDDSKQAN